MTEEREALQRTTLKQGWISALIKDFYDTEKWIVDKLINRRIMMTQRKSHVEYLIQWLDYKLEDDTWLSVDDLQNCKKLINEYEESYKN